LSKPLCQPPPNPEATLPTISISAESGRRPASGPPSCSLPLLVVTVVNWPPVTEPYQQNLLAVVRHLEPFERYFSRFFEASVGQYQLIALGNSQLQHIAPDS